MSTYTIDGYPTNSRRIDPVESIELQSVETLPLPEVLEVTAYQGGINSPKGLPPIPCKGKADHLLIDSELDLVGWE
jgi:hypothetical protein